MCDWGAVRLGTEGHLFLDMGYSMDDTYELKITAADQLVVHLLMYELWRMLSGWSLPLQ